jgi:hypothetical protein
MALQVFPPQQWSLSDFEGISHAATPLVELGIESKVKSPWSENRLIDDPAAIPRIPFGVRNRKLPLTTTYINTPVLRLHSGLVGPDLEAAGGDTPHLRIKNAQGVEAVYLGIDSAGKGVIRSTGKDYAEVFDRSGEGTLPPGSVVAVSGDGSGLMLSSVAYDPAVVGVISGAGGLSAGAVMGGAAGEHAIEVAMAGQVFVRVCLEGGPIAPGDLLVASGTRGVGMRGADRGKLIGTVIGKALQAYADREHEGLIRMLVLNH